MHRGLGLLLALAAVACGRVGREPTPTPTPMPTATPTPVASPRAVQLPQDEGPHRDFVEWWYWSGHLEAADGAEYGFHLVFFEGRLPGWGGVMRVAHFAVTDRQRASFSYAQRLTLGEDIRPQAGFDLELDGWRATGSGGEEALAAETEDYTLALVLTSAKPPVRHGDRGVMPPLGGPPFYYYSRTRMRAEGSLSVGGVPAEVEGTVWMDHQWGDLDIETAYDWDWFGLQLSDGYDLMLSLVRDADGMPVLDYGTLVAPSGEAQHLGRQDIRAEPLRFWSSPRSGGRYPVAWRLEVVPAGLTLEVEAVLDDQELDTTLTTGVIYWEGEVVVGGTSRGQPVSGTGHLELTGYAEVPSSPPRRPPP